MTTYVEEVLDGVEKSDLLRMEKLLAIRDTRIKFATEFHRNTRGEKMDFESFPHIREMYHSMAPNIVLQGSVQSMKSEWGIIDHLSCAYNGMAVFFVVPKYEMRNTFVQNRVDRAIQISSKYKDIIKGGFFDNVAIKQFGKGVIKYVGSNVIADFKEFPGDILFVEEVDQCDKDNVAYGLDRLRGSNFQFTRYLGNPTFDDEGINFFFKKSNQKEWYVPCKKCGEFSELDWFEAVCQEQVDKEGNVLGYTLLDKEWHEGIRRDIRCICTKCGGVLDRFSQDGKWIPKNPVSKIDGYHISMLVSPINEIAGMWDRFQSAQDDPSLLERFFNSDLGIPFQATGTRLTEGLLERATLCDTPFRMTIDGNKGFVPSSEVKNMCSMGVDVGSVFDVRVSEIKGNVRKAVFIGKVKTVAELHDLISEYNVERCVMDAGPETMLAQDFQDDSICDTWLCRYASEGDSRRIRKDIKNRILNVDRTMIMDKSFAKIRGSKNHLPTNFKYLINGMFIKEMLGPARQTVKDTKGNPKVTWTKCIDHQRHADTYDCLAALTLESTIIEDVFVG